jgi:hypothetical protein
VFWEDTGGVLDCDGGVEMTEQELKVKVSDLIYYGECAQNSADEIAEQVIELVSKHERRKTLVAFTDYCSELGI